MVVLLLNEGVSNFPGAVQYQYTTSWSLGYWGAGAAVQAMGILAGNPNGAFPFYVEGQNGNANIVLGGNYCLHTNVILAIGCDHVHVIYKSPTQFTFLGLAGHIEGFGSTITFSTRVTNGLLILTQQAQGPDAFGSLGGFTFVNGWRWSAAQSLWSQQARNLVSELYKYHGHNPFWWNN
jgi:hypothetical protein